MKIHLRERKLTKSGKVSLYLEYYKGYHVVNGKTKHDREFENLDLYLYLNPKNKEQRNHNKETKLLADKIRNKRQSEYDHGKFGFPSKHKSKASFFAFFEKLMEERKDNKGNYGNWDSTFKHLKKYHPSDITFRDLDEDFVKGFRDYLNKRATTKSKTLLSQNTKHSYFNKFKAALNQAFTDKIINDNPGRRVKGFKMGETKREYLTYEELQKLANTECKYKVLKNAFLFSCLSGLRWSDIQKLVWEEVRDTENGSRIIFKQQKTNGVEYLDISQQARDLLGERKEPKTRVFKGLKYNSTYNIALIRWAMNAGINKPITFHAARHTNAVLMLEFGADIYTVSKRLGHKEIRTTEVYAKILDKKMKEAANIIPEIKIENNDIQKEEE